MGAWIEAKDFTRRIALGEFSERSRPWHVHNKRVANLPEDIGEEIERLFISKRRAIHIAYGRTRQEQRRRLDEARLLHVQPRNLNPNQMIKLEVSVHVPENVVTGPPEELQAFLVLNVQAIITHLHRRPPAPIAPATSPPAPIAPATITHLHRRPRARIAPATIALREETVGGELESEGAPVDVAPEPVAVEPLQLAEDAPPPAHVSGFQLLENARTRPLVAGPPTSRVDAGNG